MSPPLPLSPLGIRIGHLASPKVILEMYMDMNCPPSKRAFMRLIDEVQPYYGAKKEKFQLCFYVTPQPWHPQSCILNEAILAAQSLKADAAIPMMKAVYQKQDDFSDAKTMDKTRAQINSMLGDIAQEIGIPKPAFMQKLALKEGGGTYTTQALKFYVKHHRQRGIHVTPTAAVNGVLCETSSSWTLEEWRAFIDPILHPTG
mmetsp:Transcript_5776/g.13568  ORF Transcript_5776/g.13568 Transcript_5776/m.13568 type:complete len:202 (-) Transcript_5776:3721-4326(-)